jgi:hypothetical protein
VDPVAVLDVLVRARGISETNRSLGETEDKLHRTERAAADATDKIDRLGHTTAHPLVELQAEGLRAQIAQARQQLDDLARQKPSPEVTIQTGKAAAELERFKAKLDKLNGQTATVRVKVTGDKVADVDKAAGGGGGGIRDTQRALDGFSNSAGGATATLGGFRIALAALVPVTIGFGGAAVAAGASLVSLIGLAAAAGNALAAAGQGMGVFKLATFGVVDALKEQTDNQSKAGGAAIDQAGQQRAAARAIQGAHEGVRAATQALTDAEQEQRKAVEALPAAYTAARMRLTDLREATRDAAISLRGAQIAAVDAHQALSELLHGADPRELADAHRAVMDAVRGEDDAVQGLRDAYQALNDLLKPPDVLSVADAQDAVADAVRNEERARLGLNDQIAKTNAVLADPAATGDEQARARLDLADAENAVGDAARGSEHARINLTKLEAGPEQAAVEEARRRVSDAEYAVQKAAEGTTTARQDLAKVESPAGALDLAKARQAVAEAENAVGDAQRDRMRASRELGAAEAAGIDRSPEVVAAMDAVEKAERGVTDASRNVKQAQQALSDAQLSAAESAAKAAGASADLNKKFNDLPPAAQAFVRELQDMKPKLDELRDTAASGFFPGATEGLHAAAENFDSVNKVVGETATVLGEAARKSGELVGSPAFGRDIETIGGRNAKVLDTLGEALRHVVSGLRYVLLAAGPLTQHLADLVNGWAKNAAEAAKAGEQTGRLAHFFEQTEAITKRLLSVLGHLGRGLLGVADAGKETGDGIWKSIDRAAGRFDEWANSAKGQSALKDFFRETKELAAALIPIFTGVGGGLGFVVLKALPLTAILRVLGPLADEATVAFVAWKVAVLAWNAQVAISTFLTGGWVTAFWALNAAMAANPIGLVVLAIGAIIAAGYLLIDNWDAVTDALGAAWDWIKTAVGDLIDWLGEHWPLILAILTGPIGLAVLAIVKHWDAIKDATTSAWNAIKDFLGSIWDWIKTAAGDAAGAVRDAVTGAWNTISNATSTVWNAVKETVTGVASAIATAVKDAIGGLRDWLSDAWGSISEKARDVWGDVKGAITGAVKAAFETVKGLVGDFVSIGGDIVRGIAKGITDAASSVIDAIGDVVSGAVKHAKKLLHIGSPSRVFMEIGAFTGQGFAQGVAAQVATAQRELGRLVAPPTAGMVPAGPGGAMAARPAAAPAGRAGPLIVQNIDRYVVGERDDNAVAARLAWLMDTA